MTPSQPDSANEIQRTANSERLERLTLACWQCPKTFQLTLDIAGSPLFIKACAYCGAPCAIDLNPHRDSNRAMLRRSGETVTEDSDVRWPLPEVIETTEPQKED